MTTRIPNRKVIVTNWIGQVLMAAILLQVVFFKFTGAALALGVIVGAIGTHLTILGIEVQGDGGALLAMALITFVAAAAVVWIRRHSLPVLGRVLAPAPAAPIVD